MAADNALALKPDISQSWFKNSCRERANYAFFKLGEDVSTTWTKTKKVARILEAKIIVSQCPANFTKTAKNTENMKYSFTRNKGSFIFVWEPRGNWGEDAILTLRRDLGLVHRSNPLGRKLFLES